jgi:flagellar biogenesis protein FliO
LRIDESMEFISQMTAAVAVLGLLGAALWWLRRRGLAVVAPVGRRGARRMECLERMALGPQHTLHLVRLGETALLVASSPGGCSLVRSVPWKQIEPAREVGR